MDIWESMKRTIAEHDTEKPFAPENGQPLKFAAGDNVLFTNENGAEFVLKITGLLTKDADAVMYAYGYRYLVNSSSPWFPAKEANLTYLFP